MTQKRFSIYERLSFPFDRTVYGSNGGAHNMQCNKYVLAQIKTN